MPEKRTSSRLKKKPEEDDGAAAAAPAPAPPKKSRAKPKKEVVEELPPGSPAAAAAASVPTPVPSPLPVPPSPAAAAPAPEPREVSVDEEEEEEEEEEEAPPPSPAAAMDASQASASQGTMTGVEEEEEEPLTLTMYKVDSSTKLTLAERINELLPAFGEKTVPFTNLMPAGDTTPIFAFTVARAKPGVYRGKDYSLETDDPDKVALLGFVIVYAGASDVVNAKFVILSTRLTLLPSEEGFVPNPYILFGVPKVAEFIRTTIAPGQVVLLRVPRKQKMGDAEYLGTLGTLASLGFAYSRYTTTGEEVKFKLLDKDDPVEYGALEATSKEGIEKVTYKYRLPDQVVSTVPFTFNQIESVQVTRPGKMEPAETVELVADSLTVSGGVPAGKDITIPAAVLQDVQPMPPRRGGKQRKTRRRTTYRKSARKGKTARRR